jgi:LuxR family maltose regulon positive regulatory protein
MEGVTQLHRLEFAAAAQNFSAASEHPHTFDARLTIDSLAGLALTHQLMGQPEAADETVQRLIQFAYELNDPVQVGVAHACEARIQLLQGNFLQAFSWAKSASEPLDPFALFFWLEVPQITRIRVLIAEGSTESLNKAAELLQEIQELAEASRFTCQTIEISALQCLLLEKQGFGDKALASLEGAVAMAEQGGWLRPFVELGLPMAGLLQCFTKQKGHSSLLSVVLESFANNEMQIPAGMVKSQSAVNRQGMHGEALTKREQIILELLVHRLQNKEIASRLFVSTETVKTHLKHLYQKLGVNNRLEAAMKAEQLILAKGTVLEPGTMDNYKQLKRSYINAA